METIREQLSVAEAAMAAGVSIAEVNRVVDRKILPQELFSTSETRTFRREACVFISFYFKTADSLTMAARMRAIRNSLAHAHSWSDLKRSRTEESSAIQVSFLPFFIEVERRLNQLQRAQEMVVEDPEIFQGLPTIRGTRIPVHDVADWMNADTPTEELREMYPRLKKEQFDLALVYATAHPRKGRPKSRSFPKRLQISATKKRLRNSSIRGSSHVETARR
jgi:uncharacterized protein (DUF433 family)